MAAVIPRASDPALLVTGWRRFGTLTAIVVGVTLLYWPVARSLGVLWLDTNRTTYAHGFVILAVSCWMLWRNRAEFITAAPAASPLSTAIWLALLAGTVIAWQLAYRAGVQLGTEILLLVLLWLAIGALMGARAARAAFLPVAFMGFALTWWDALNPLAHEATVRAVHLLLQLFGVPTFFEGDVVHIPEGTFEIQGGCSGLHFLIVSLAMATLIGELRGDRRRRRVQWILLGAALALAVNWLRVSTIILAGHLTHMQSYVVRESHYGYGWVLFALAMLAMFLVERRVPLDPAPREPAPVSAGARPRMILPTVVTAMLALPLVLNVLIERKVASAATLVTPVPRGWTPVAARTDDWRPRQLQSDGESRDAFSLGAAHVERYVAEYLEQRPTKKVGGYANRPQGDAEVVDRQQAVVADWPSTLLRLEDHNRQSILWFTYLVDDRPFADATRAQLWYSLHTLRSLSSPASRMIALWAPCEPDCATALQALQKFAGDGGIQ